MLRVLRRKQPSVRNTRIWHQKAATYAKLGCPCRHAFVKVQQHNADAEEIALAACEISHNIQSSAAYLQGTARHGTKLLEDSKQSYMPSRSLRSETGNLLIMPKACRKLGCHTFAYAVPKLWNELPVNIRTTSLVSFRSSLNTHLFKLAYAWLVSSVLTCSTNCSFYLIYNYTFLLLLLHERTFILI